MDGDGVWRTGGRLMMGVVPLMGIVGPVRVNGAAPHEDVSGRGPRSLPNEPLSPWYEPLPPLKEPLSPAYAPLPPLMP